MPPCSSARGIVVLSLRTLGARFARERAIYHVNSGRWSAGPDFPTIPGEGQLDVADGPAALLSNGRVLVVASAGLFNAPAHVFEFDGTTLTEVAAQRT